MDYAPLILGLIIIGIGWGIVLKMRKKPPRKWEEVGPDKIPF